MILADKKRQSHFLQRRRGTKAKSLEKNIQINTFEGPNEPLSILADSFQCASPHLGAALVARPASPSYFARRRQRNLFDELAWRSL